MLIHIILGILKIIGILLLAVLGLFLLLFFSLLFVPVRYYGKGYKDADGYEGKITVSWLFHLIWFRGSYGSDRKEWKLSVRIFGIPLEKLKGILENRKKKKNKKSEKTTAKVPVSQEEKPVKTSLEEEKKTEETIEKTEKAEKTEKKKANSRIRKLLSWPDRILKSLRNFRLTVKKICDKIKQTKNMLDSESFREAKTFLVGECKKIFLHIRPGKIKGEIRFGCEDPALTGQILAVAGICYPLYGKSFSLYPYFDRKILEGKVEFRGRIRGALFAGVAWRTFRNSHIKTLGKKIRH